MVSVLHGWSHERCSASHIVILICLISLVAGNLGVNVEMYARRTVRLAKQIEDHLPTDPEDSDAESDILLPQDVVCLNAEPSPTMEQVD